MITSRSNEKVKMVAGLAGSQSSRKEAGLFVVEGPRMVSEIPTGWAYEVFVSESFIKRHELPSNIAGLPVTEVSDDVFAKMSDTKSPQGLLALVKMPHTTLEDMLGKGPIIILEGIQDPGNLGTMLRTGEGAGIGGIIADSQTVDAFNPKVIRATMGAIFRVPICYTDDLADEIAKIKESGYEIYAAHLNGGMLYDEPLSRKAAFMIGNEGNGLSDGILGLSDHQIRIPMEGKVESLNAAISAGLLAYEWHRQYRKRP